jgi:tRNA A-37 threonylcarbamoyl transferase component Bud32
MPTDQRPGAARTSLPSPAEFEFEPLLTLGEGGMGSVTLARARGVAGFERLVAVKRMKPEVMDRPHFTERFLDEAQLAAHVRHANVVSVQQLGQDSQGLFLVLDYVEGASLDTLIDRCVDAGGRPPTPIALRIISDALAGLHAVHEASDSVGRALNILHRDVSTQNIMVGRDGIARLSDFGVAKSTHARHVTEKNRLFGRILYMPPEYLHQSPIDRRLDVYAMGVTMFIALTGVEPWADATDVTLVSRILTEGVPPMSSTGLTVAPELEAVVKKATETEPEKRYATAAEMNREIEQIARRAGWMGTQSEVATFVEELEGRRLAARRTAVASGATMPRTSDAVEAPTLEAVTAPKAPPVEEPDPAGDRASEVRPLPIKKVERVVASRQATSLGMGPSSRGSIPVSAPPISITDPSVPVPLPFSAVAPVPASSAPAGDRPSYGGKTRKGLGKPQAPLVGKVARPRSPTEDDEVDLTQYTRAKLPTWVWIAAAASIVIGILGALFLTR